MTRPAPAPSRIVIVDVSPQVDGGRFPVKRVVGEPVTVGATVFADGHDRVHVVVSHQPPRAAGRKGWVDVEMVSVNPGLDRWEATFTPAAEGTHRYEVQAWIDPFATWCDATRRKLDAGLDVTSELRAGAALLGDLAEVAARRDQKALRAAAAELAAGVIDVVIDPRAELDALVHAALRRGDATTSATLAARVEPERALFSSWYELFPRSAAPPTAPDGVPGTLRDVIDRLDEIAELGFDVLYLPPIHPIGTAFRKGPDDAEVAAPGDPGSPWAIGSAEGGHTAVDPDLGTVADVAELAAAAAEQGIDLALDLAFQCSPDHPWVTEHPEWFVHRPDGSIQYAENPPKKYQDIYPLAFEGPAWRALWDALLDVTCFWVDQGVRTFRVDNPHTKPFAFWTWLIDQVHQRDPGVVFLAEAFTRPLVMQRLGQVGFTQGYTYFTWRTSKGELVDYFSELASPPSVDQFRPNAWPTTPDILPAGLQHAPLEAFALRAVLAATLSPSYGIFGPTFELGETEPVAGGKEELAGSEKYEVRRWDLTEARTLRPLLADLNRIRHDQLALHTLRTLRFHDTDNDALICYSKTAHAGPSTDPALLGQASVLVVVNLDAERVQAANVDLDLAALGLDPDEPFEVHDLLTERTFVWSGPRNFVLLDPAQQPAHVFRVTRSGAH